MKLIDCPINFKQLTKEYKTTNLTVIYKEKNREGFNGKAFRPRYIRRKIAGKWYRDHHVITLTLGKNSYPYTAKDITGIKFIANSKEELILFLFWHEFGHYLDHKFNKKTKHRELSEIAYNRVWSGKK